MTKTIRVHVIAEKGRRNLSMRYLDPLTGLHCKRSAGTGNRREAERRAREWEAEVNQKRASGAQSATWSQFRRRYDAEALTGLAAETARKVGYIFNLFEEFLPIIKDQDLEEVTAERISHFTQELRKGGRSENTIASYLGHLRAGLRWAAEQGLLRMAPRIRRPKRAKRSSKGMAATPMKGRPITTEEFERMLAKVPAALTRQPKERKDSRESPPQPTPRKRPPVRRPPKPPAPEAVQAWRHFLRGLWWSGLRLEESLNLYWDRPDRLCVDLTSKRPMLRILAELEKGHQDRLLPIAPEFAEFLLKTPEEQRTGRVFRLRGRAGTGGFLTSQQVSRVVSRIGKAAGVKVHTHPKTGKVKFASAHDLRRSFGERWSPRVMPQVLMVLMRHQTIDTTMRYYVGRNADTTADAVWTAYEGLKCTDRGEMGTNSGTPEAVPVTKAE